jgi:hypothetical protein
MCRGIGRAEVDRVTATNQAQRNGRGDRGLADATFAHDHDQAAPVRRELIDEAVEGIVCYR